MFVLTFFVLESKYLFYYWFTLLLIKTFHIHFFPANYKKDLSVDHTKQ